MDTQRTHAAGRQPPFGKIAGLLLTSAMAATIATPAQARGVRAGTIVANTATATYDIGPTTTTINSNTVSMRVDEVLDVTVASKDANDAGVAADAKNQVRTFTVTNAGNGPEAFNLTALQSSRHAGRDRYECGRHLRGRHGSPDLQRQCRASARARRFLHCSCSFRYSRDGS